MNLIDQAFLTAKEEGRTVLIPFITAGDPDPDTTVEILKHIQQAGADIVELGVPYSDPLADGPVIQRASQRALAHRITIKDCLEMASKAMTSGVTMPFILFTYFNPVLQYGLERFFADLKKYHFSGVIIPDLPIEESDEIKGMAAAQELYLIPFVAPTSNARIEQIASGATGGFVYCVSSLGVTGERADFHESIGTFLQTVKKASKVPIAVGFGVSNREHFKQLSAYADGIIVGSAIVRQVEEVIEQLKDADRKSESLKQIGHFVGHFLRD